MAKKDTNKFDPNSTSKFTKDGNIRDGKLDHLYSWDIYPFLKYPISAFILMKSWFYFLAVQKAILYLEKDELPPHWDREIIFAMDEQTSTTESSESASERSEDGEDDDDSEEDEQTPEEKDHLVAELYKHMEDKGSPINNTPAINGKGNLKFVHFGHYRDWV